MSMLGTTALAVGVVALAGCSLIYNPSNLPGPAIDAGIPIDAPTVVNRDDLALTAAGPQVLLEGQGTGGSRSAILAITGSNIAQDAVVALAPADATAPAPMIQIDNDNAVRSLSGTSIAVPVMLPIDMNRATGDVKLTIQVTQMGSAGPVVVTLADQVTLRNLPELEALAPGAVPTGLYSRVKLSANVTFAPTAGGSPIVFRAVSSIDLKDVHVDASGAMPGPGGGSGGAAMQPGAGPGGGKPGGAVVDLTHVLVAGSGGGYGQAGGIGKATLLGPGNAGGAITGDEQLRSFTSSGGSGGGGGGLNPGGGAGGSIEITAGGTLAAGTISANGAAGGAAGSILSGAAGGGSGGAVLLRSGATATLVMVAANGGAAGTGSPTAGDGGDGRLRYDLAKLAGTPALPAVRRPGVSFPMAPDANPLVTHDRQQGVALDGVVSAIPANNLYDMYVLSAAQATTYMTTVMFGTPSLVVTPILTPGYNRICVTPHGLNPLTDLVSTNCIDMAYVP